METGYLTRICLVMLMCIVVQSRQSIPTFRYKTPPGVRDKPTTDRPISLVTERNKLPDINTTVTWTLIDRNNTDLSPSSTVYPEPSSTAYPEPESTAYSEPEPEPEMHSFTTTVNVTVPVFLNNETIAEPETSPEPNMMTKVTTTTATVTTESPKTTTPALSVTTVGFNTVTSFWDLVFAMITTPFPGDKPGMCPDPHTVRKTCQSRCQHDNDCMYDRKCCHDGHGYGCCSDLKAPEPTFFDHIMNIPTSQLQAWSKWMSK